MRSRYHSWIIPDREMNASLDTAVFAAACAPVSARDFIDLLRRTGFSAEAYRDHYDDFAPLNWGPTEALEHFFNHGLDERRTIPMTLDRNALVALGRLPIADTGFKAKLLTGLARYLFANLDHPYGPAIVERWPVVRDLTRQGARPYFITGDSHSNHLNVTGARGGEWLLPIHLLCTAGSAAGLGNPASRSGYGPLLRDAIRTIQTLPGGNEISFLFQFSQVDIEFVYHFRRVRDRRQVLDLHDYRTFCDDTLKRYIGFVANVFDLPRRKRVFLVSVFPPALSDAAWRQGYVNDDISRRETDESVQALSEGIRKLEIANFRQRTEIHLYFNARLKAACKRLGFGFLDVATGFLGADGLLNLLYISPETQGFEHHLDSRRTYAGLVDPIWRSLDGNGPAAGLGDTG
jgi:hypothetical protein